MNALELLREARNRELDVPFVVITGRGDEAAAVAALKLGAYDYIVKRDGYLTHLPHALDNAIGRAQLARLNQHLQTELTDGSVRSTPRRNRWRCSTRCSGTRRSASGSWTVTTAING